MRAKTLYANFKTTHFVEYLGSMLIDFHDTSIVGIVLYVEDLLHHPLLPAFNLHNNTHIQTYIHTCMHVCVTNLFVPNAVLTFHQMSCSLGRDILWPSVILLWVRLTFGQILG